VPTTCPKALFPKIFGGTIDETKYQFNEIYQIDLFMDEIVFLGMSDH
jgi:hypothetical protein